MSGHTSPLLACLLDKRMRMFKEFSEALFPELQFQQRTTRLTIVTEGNSPFEASAGR